MALTLKLISQTRLIDIFFEEKWFDTITSILK